MAVVVPRGSKAPARRRGSKAPARRRSRPFLQTAPVSHWRGDACGESGLTYGHSQYHDEFEDEDLAALGDGLDPDTLIEACQGERCGGNGDRPETVDAKRHPILGAGWRFLQLGGLAFALNLAITATGHEVLDLPAAAAFGIALVTVFFLNFFGFRRFVYRATGGAARRQMLRFVAAIIPLRAAEYGAFVMLHAVAGMDYLLATVLVLSASAIAKFITFRVWVFAT